MAGTNGGASPHEARGTAARRLLDAVLEHAPIGLGFLDRDLRWVRCNPRLAEIDGLAVGDHLGRRVDDVLHGLGAEVLDAIHQVFATAEPVMDLEVTATTDDERPRTWLTSFYAIPNETGVIGWVGCVVVDITDRTRSEAERERLLAAEHVARTTAEQAASRLGRLQQLTALLSDARTTSDVTDLLAGHAREALDAVGMAVMLLSRDAAALELVHAEGYDPEVLASYRRVPLDVSTPAGDAVREGAPVFLPGVRERDARYPAFAGHSARELASAVLPLAVEERTFGVLAASWEGRRDFDDDEQRFLLAVADQASQALDRARLAEAERRAADRERFLARILEELSATTDDERALSRVANLLLPHFADSCSVYLQDERGLRRIATAHTDPELQSVVEALAARDGAYTSNPVLLEVARTGEASMAPDVPDELLDTLVPDEEHRALIRRLQIRSGMVVPIVARGRSLGVLGMAMGPSQRRYDDDDLTIVADLAQRVGQAIDAARAQRDRLAQVRTLQRSLLPPRLPHVEGLELAARYVFAKATDVGGDFYDVAAAGAGIWTVTIGDVCGKGVEAASLTALCRYTARAAGLRERSPAAILGVVNEAILVQDVGERFATMVVIMAQPLEGRVDIRLAVGGHPLPLLLAREGGIVPLGQPGTAVGLVREAEFSDVAHVLSPGDMVVLVTDGYLEARSPEGHFDPDLFPATVERVRGMTAAAAAAALEEAVLAFSGGAPRDDMAVVVLRVPD